MELRRGSRGQHGAPARPALLPAPPAHPLGMSPTTEMPNLDFRLTP